MPEVVVSAAILLRLIRTRSHRHRLLVFQGTASDPACHPRPLPPRDTLHRRRRQHHLCHARSAAGQHTPSARLSSARHRRPTPLRLRRLPVRLPTTRHSRPPTAWVASPSRRRMASWPVDKTGARRIWEGTRRNSTSTPGRGTTGTALGNAGHTPLGGHASCWCWAWCCSL